MKKLLALALALVMMLTVFAGCGAKTSDSDWANIEKAGEMVIGYTVYAPMNYEEDGKFVGFDTEYAEAVCDKLGVTPKFIEINWDTKEVDLAAKKMDCVWNGFTITAEREEQLDFTNPYIKNRQVVVIRKADAEIIEIE